MRLGETLWPRNLHRTPIVPRQATYIAAPSDNRATTLLRTTNWNDRHTRIGDRHCRIVSAYVPIPTKVHRIATQAMMSNEWPRGELTTTP